MKFEKIHEDKRGAIYLVGGLLDRSREYTFMEINQGYARGGCLHANDEYFAVISGKVKYVHGDKESILEQGSSGKIPAQVPHAFIALENSIVSEWGITTEEKKADIRDPKLRSLVDAINKERGI